MIKRALLIVGSPKPNKSTSEQLGKYILDRIKNKNIETDIIRLNNLSKIEWDKLTESVNNCDILIFSSPLYVDSLPASVIKVMEVIAERRKERGLTKKQVMMAISNSGFPEAFQNHPALGIYKCFAKEAGFDWAGGLAIGGGGVIAGKPLEKMGGMVKNIIKSLNLTADALLLGKAVPEEAVKLIKKPMMPNWLYFLGGNFGWKLQAKKFGVHKKLDQRPFEE